MELCCTDAKTIITVANSSGTGNNQLLDSIRLTTVLFPVFLLVILSEDAHVHVVMDTLEPKIIPVHTASKVGRVGR